MIRVFSHGPKRDGNIGPNVRGMRVAKITIFAFHPILWRSVFTVRGDHSTPLFYIGKIESEFVGHGKKPDVFGGVLPISFRADSDQANPVPSDATCAAGAVAP